MKAAKWVTILTPEIRHVDTNIDAPKGELMENQNQLFVWYFTIAAILRYDKIKARGWQKTSSN